MTQLPRGRHQLSPQTVELDQRRRMLAAMCAALEQHGYAQTTVAQVLEEAGVSRRTFYEQFADKDACLLAAYEEAEQRAWGLAAGAAAAVPALVEAGEPSDLDREPHDARCRRVRAALAAVLDFCAAEPATARLFTLETRAALPQIAVRQREALDRAAGSLRDENGARASRADLPEDIERRLVDNVAALVGSYVVSGATELLPGLTSQLAEHLLQPYVEEQQPAAR